MDKDNLKRSHTEYTKLTEFHGDKIIDYSFINKSLCPP